VGAAEALRRTFGDHFAAPRAGASPGAGTKPSRASAGGRAEPGLSGFAPLQSTSFAGARRAPREDPPVFISEAHAQAAPAAGADSMFGSLGSMLPLVLMFVVLYFVMIRPQMKKQKEHKAMIDALAKGDEVVTSGGVLGKVSKMGESFLSVEVASGVEIQVQRSAVVQVMPKGTVK
jgi:preprotein translocase subunit YajC